ncbi:hypothetical protein FKM82_019104 [Ascaphus truei]
MDLYDELPEPPRFPAPAVSGTDAAPPAGDPAGKRRADTADLPASCEHRHQEKKVCKGLVSVKAHVAERRGEREELQDAHTICDLSQECEPLPAHM